MASRAKRALAPARPLLLQRGRPSHGQPREAGAALTVGGYATEMQLSDSERASGRLAPSTVHAAVEHVRNNGFVLFERVLPRDLVADMQSSFAGLIDTHPSSTEANRGANRFQMHLPFEPPFNDERLIASTFVLPIVDALTASATTSPPTRRCLAPTTRRSTPISSRCFRSGRPQCRHTASC